MVWKGFCIGNIQTDLRQNPHRMMFLRSPLIINIKMVRPNLFTRIVQTDVKPLLHIQESMALVKTKPCLLQQMIDTEDMILCEYIWWHCRVYTTPVPGPRRSFPPFWHLDTVLAQVPMWPQCEPIRLGKWTDCKTSVHTAVEITASTDCFLTYSHSVLSLSSIFFNKQQESLEKI